jgi:hypothetical protein
MIASIFFIGMFLDFLLRCSAKRRETAQAELYRAHSICQTNLPRKSRRGPPGRIQSAAGGSKLRQIAGQRTQKGHERTKPPGIGKDTAKIFPSEAETMLNK